MAAPAPAPMPVVHREHWYVACVPTHGRLHTPTALTKSKCTALSYTDLALQTSTGACHKAAFITALG